MNFCNNIINNFLKVNLSIFIFADKIVEYFREMLYTNFNELIKNDKIFFINIYNILLVTVCLITYIFN